MTQWVRGLILALFLASYPLTYFIGANNKDNEWQQRYSQMVENYNITMVGITNKLKAQESGFKAQIELITRNSENAEKEFEKKLADLNTRNTVSLQQSTKRADVYRSQARASEAERENLAAHAARLDEALVEGKAVAGELRLTLEKREDELRELGDVLKAIEKKYE